MPTGRLNLELREQLSFHWETQLRPRLDGLTDEEYAHWQAGVTGLGEEGQRRPVGVAEGEHSDSPYSELVLHINREAIHHLAEVCLLRDLFAHTAADRR